MQRAFRIGRVLGIELRVDPSWLVIFVLVTWSLSSLFGVWHPDWPAWTSFVVAALASILFFASVLFHELAHSLVARAYGIPVRDITLHMFGGVSSIEREPERPGQELFIAIVGPIASIGLGIGMLVATTLATGLAYADDGGHGSDAAGMALRLGPLTTLLVWLGPVNVTVGLFNLIPGLPLDGGRILRALVWKVTGDLRRATRAAAIVGQGVGWLFVVLGIAMAFGVAVPFFGRGLVGGVWLVLIGTFLRNAAAQQLALSAVKDALDGVRVGDLMRTRGPWVGAGVTLRAFVDHWLARSDDDGFPVFDDGRFVGFLGLREVRASPDGERRTVREAMTPPERLVAVTPDDSAYEALRRMGSAERNTIPVVSGGALVGVLSERDVARWVELRPARRPSAGARPHLAGARA